MSSYKHWHHYPSTSTRDMDISGISHPPSSQSVSHNLITDTSDTRDMQLFRSPQTSKGGLKAVIQRPLSAGCGSLWWLWMDRFGANVVWGDMYCDNSSVNTPSADPQWARRERALKMWHLRGMLGTISLLIPPPTLNPHPVRTYRSIQHWPHYEICLGE